ncbi:MAG: hypothetical protein Q9174_002568 [Haloplaca sp. 1 TL-2023]
MSYLKGQVQSFNANLGTAASKISNKRTIAPPKPTPSANASQPSDPPRNDLKRKRPMLPEVPYSQPKDSGTGQYLMTQIHFVIEYLKGKSTPQTLPDILSYLSVQTRDDTIKRKLEHILIRHERIEYTPKNGTKPAVFSFRPAYGVRSRETLIGYLQSQRTFQGLKVKEIKEGWANAEDEIGDLEDEGRLSVIRHKKEGNAVYVWLNDPSLGFDVDEEFQDIWHKIRLPDPEALAQELEKEGLTPANKNRSTKKPVKVQEKPKRKARAGGKTTNVHMAGVLKDFSHLKK